MQVSNAIIRAWAALVLWFAVGAETLAGPLLVGYWHNWTGKSTAYIRLREVPSLYNQINVAFAVPSPKNDGSMIFTPKHQTPEELKRDIAFLQARGTRVLLSIGGGNHPVVLNTRQQAQAFTRSLVKILTEYGFNGLDINLEKHSLALAPGDLDFRRPTTPRVVHFIEGVRAIVAQYDSSFVLSASPETQFLTAGYKRYGGEYGGYLPVLHALRDQLDLVHMQYYNSGTQLVYEGGRRSEKEPIVTKGTPDFIVALTEMLILGFPVAQNPKMMFPGFGAHKIAIGLPATPAAASGGGYLKPADLRAALHYLLTGQPTYRTAYRMRQKGGHPALAGIMTWSINWDASRDGGTQPYDFVREAKGLWRR
jgi:chitinase